MFSSLASHSGLWSDFSHQPRWRRRTQTDSRRPLFPRRRYDHLRHVGFVLGTFANKYVKKCCLKKKRNKQQTKWSSFMIYCLTVILLFILFNKLWPIKYVCFSLFMIIDMFKLLISIMMPFFFLFFACLKTRHHKCNVEILQTLYCVRLVTGWHALNSYALCELMTCTPHFNMYNGLTHIPEQTSESAAIVLKYVSRRNSESERWKWGDLQRRMNEGFSVCGVLPVGWLRDDACVCVCVCVCAPACT